jgi:hypothetical protein
MKFFKEMLTNNKSTKFKIEEVLDMGNRAVLLTRYNWVERGARMIMSRGAEILKMNDKRQGYRDPIVR